MGRTKGKITPKGMPTSASALLNAIAQSSTSNSSNNSNSGSSSETNNNGSPKLARSRRLSTRSSSDESLISGSSLSTNQVSGGPLKDEQASAAAAAAAAASTNSSNANAVRLRQGYPSRDPPSDARTQAPLRAFDVEPDWIPCPDDKDCLKHSEFGFCEEQDYRYTSQWRGWEADDLKVTEEEPSLLTYLSTYLSYIILIVIGHVRDFFGRKLRKEAYVHLMEQDVGVPLSKVTETSAEFQENGMLICFLSLGHPGLRSSQLRREFCLFSQPNALKATNRAARQRSSGTLAHHLSLLPAVRQLLHTSVKNAH